MIEPAPCRHCGKSSVAYEHQKHWTGMRWQMLSTELRHDCIDGYDEPFNRILIKVRAKTDEEAVALWNKFQGLAA